MAGSFSRQRAMTRSSPAGTSFLNAEMDGAGSVAIRIASSAIDFASKARRPARSS